jgi:hypothetical protein
LEGLGVEIVGYILNPFGKIYGHMVCFMALGYNMLSFGIFSPVLVCCTKKNLATLLIGRMLLDKLLLF